MRLLPLSILFLIAFCLVRSAPATPSHFPERLVVSEPRNCCAIPGLKDFLSRLRARFLRTRTSERLVKSFTTQSPRTQSTRVPDESAVAAYSQFATVAPAGGVEDLTDQAYARFASLSPERENAEVQSKRQSALGLWIKAGRARQEASTGEDMTGKGRLSSESFSPRVSVVSPRVSVSSRVARGKEVEMRPGSSPRMQMGKLVTADSNPRVQRTSKVESERVDPSTLRRLSLDQRRQSTGEVDDSPTIRRLRGQESRLSSSGRRAPVDSPSMRKFHFFADEEYKYPALRKIEPHDQLASRINFKSEHRGAEGSQSERYPVGWKPSRNNAFDS